jgi:hypothetical protein
MQVKLNLLLMAFLLFCYSFCWAQKDTLRKANNIVYVEALGAAGIYSVNYERLFWFNEALCLSPRIGFEYLFLDGGNYFRSPIMLSICYRIKNSHFVDLGYGIWIAHDYSTVSNAYNNYSGRVANIGYRYQPLNKSRKLFFAIRFTSFFDHLSKGNMFFKPWVGIGIGQIF